MKFTVPDYTPKPAVISIDQSGYDVHIRVNGKLVAWFSGNNTDEKGHLNLIRGVHSDAAEVLEMDGDKIKVY